METRVTPASLQAKARSAVTSSGFASIVISAPPRMEKRDARAETSRESCAAGTSEGVPPPRYRVSKDSPSASAPSSSASRSSAAR